MCFQTKASVDKLLSALDLAVNITSTTTASGEGEKIIKQKNLNVSIEKDSTDTFLNRSEIKRDGFSLDMTNGTLDNVTATEMEIQVSFDKNKYINNPETLYLLYEYPFCIFKGLLTILFLDCIYTLHKKKRNM